MDYLAQNWLLALIALVAAIVIAWYVFHAARRTRITGERRDVLDEGAAPATRNQALIDTAPAATREMPLPPVTPAGLAGVGEVVSVMVEQDQLARDGIEVDSGGDAGAEDIARLKGVGPKLVAMLRDLGVTRLAQIAGWSEADIDRIDAQLGRFEGRIRRDSWVEQAQLLTAGDEAAYAARFGQTN